MRAFKTQSNLSKQINEQLQDGMTEMETDQVDTNAVLTVEELEALLSEPSEDTSFPVGWDWALDTSSSTFMQPMPYQTYLTDTTTICIQNDTSTTTVKADVPLYNTNYVHFG